MRLSRSLGAWLFLFAMLPACQSNRVSVPAVIQSYESLPPRPFETLVREYGLQDAQTGFAVWSLSNPRWVAGRQEKTPLAPASSQKIATAIGALEVLGPNRRFRTTAWGNLPPKGGRGEVSRLVLRGEGDPVVTTAELQVLVEQLRAAGVRKVGRLEFDATFFPEANSVTDEVDIAAAYNSGVSALSSEFNRVSVTVTPAASGIRQLYFVPTLPLFQWQTAERPHPFTPGVPSSELPEAERWEVSAQVADGSSALPVRVPAAWTAGLFHRLLVSQGITVDTSPARTHSIVGLRSLASVESPTVREIVERNLEFSNNLLSEVLLLHIGKQLSKRSVSASESAELLKAWYARRLPGVSWRDVQWFNGSGLAPRARISPAHLVELLAWAYPHRYEKRSFLSMLPRGGFSGTLRNRFQNPDTALRVWAKTGSLDFASALAGYFFSRSGEVFAFALMTEDRAKRDHRAEWDVKKWDSAAERWMNQAKRFEEEMVRTWIDAN